MRKIKILSAVFLILIFTLQLFGCKVELPEPAEISSADEAISMDFYAKEYKNTMKVGEYTWMNVNIKIDYEYSLKWTSSNPKVATVDASGRVDALAPGKVTITAHAKKASVDFNITVSEKKAVKLSSSTAITANDTTLLENASAENNAKLYRLLINSKTNCATVYTYNTSGVYNVAVRSMVCSVGREGLTPETTYTLGEKNKWNEVDDKFYQYYCTLYNEEEDVETSISSMPYSEKGASKLITKEYNKLGTASTDGAIRFSVDDAKWIYDNCEEGTVIKVDSSTKDALKRPTPIKVSETSKHAGWDPTDPVETNPFKKLLPYFEGAPDTYVQVNGVFDSYDGVVAYDTGGNVVEDKIIIEGNVNTAKEGSYVITYKFTDSLGRTGRKDRTVTVLSQSKYNEMMESTDSQ